MNEICITELRFPTSCRPDMVFHAHLLYEESNPPNIFLKVYYEIGGPDLLRIQNNVLGGKSSDVINIIEINSENVVGITILDKYISRIESRLTGYYDDKIGKRYFKIYLKNIRVESKVLTKEKSNSYFYLNRPSIPLIGDNYGFIYYDSGKWEAKNKNKISINFDDIGVEFRMLYHKKSEFPKNDELVIKQTPVICADYFTSKGSQVEKCVEASCMLASFFLVEDIDFYKGVYYVDNKKILILKTISNLSNNPKRYQCKHSEYEDFYSFLNSIRNKNILFEKFSVLKQLISKFILAYHLSSESRFMIFYNIIENVRKEFYPKGGKKKKTTFKFNFKTREEEDSFFESIEKQLIDHVIDIDKESFKEIIVKRLKEKVHHLPNLNQFRNFFNTLNINPQEYDLDFRLTNKLRNKIYHGTLNHENKQLIEVNQKIHKFTAKLIRILIDSDDNIDCEKRTEKEFKESGSL